MTFLIKDIRHIGIAVTSMENSLHFYRDLLDLKIERVMDEHGEYTDNMLSLTNIKLKTVKLSANNGPTLIELLEFKSHTSEQAIEKFLILEV